MAAASAAEAQVEIDCATVKPEVVTVIAVIVRAEVARASVTGFQRDSQLVVPTATETTEAAELAAAAAAAQVVHAEVVAACTVPDKMVKEPAAGSTASYGWPIVVVVGAAGAAVVGAAAVAAAVVAGVIAERGC